MQGIFPEGIKMFGSSSSQSSTAADAKDLIKKTTVNRRFGASITALAKDFATFKKIHAGTEKEYLDKKAGLLYAIDELWSDIANGSTEDTTDNLTGNGVEKIQAKNHGRLIMLFRWIYIYAQLTNTSAKNLITNLENKKGHGKLNECMFTRLIGKNKDFRLTGSDKDLYEKLKTQIFKPIHADAKDSKDQKAPAIIKKAPPLDTLAYVLHLHETADVLFAGDDASNTYLTSSPRWSETLAFRKKLADTLNPATYPSTAKIVGIDWMTPWQTLVTHNLNSFVMAPHTACFNALKEALLLAVTVTLVHEITKQETESTQTRIKRGCALELFGGIPDGTSLTTLQTALKNSRTPAELAKNFNLIINAAANRDATTIGLLQALLNIQTLSELAEIVASLTALPKYKALLANEKIRGHALSFLIEAAKTLATIESVKIIFTTAQQHPIKLTPVTADDLVEQYIKLAKALVQGKENFNAIAPEVRAFLKRIPGITSRNYPKRKITFCAVVDKAGNSVANSEMTVTSEELETILKAVLDQKKLPVANKQLEQKQPVTITAVTTDNKKDIKENKQEQETKPTEPKSSPPPLPALALPKSFKPSSCPIDIKHDAFSKASAALKTQSFENFVKALKEDCAAALSLEKHYLTPESKQDNNGRAIVIKCLEKIQAILLANNVKTLSELSTKITDLMRTAADQFAADKNNNGKKLESANSTFQALLVFQEKLSAAANKDQLRRQITDNHGTGKEFITFQTIINAFFNLLAQEELSNRQMLNGLIHLAKWCMQYHQYKTNNSASGDDLTPFLEALLPKEIEKLKAMHAALQDISASMGEDGYYFSSFIGILECVLQPKYQRPPHIIAAEFTALTIKFIPDKVSTVLGTSQQQYARLLLDRQLPFTVINANNELEITTLTVNRHTELFNRIYNFFANFIAIDEVIRNIDDYELLIMRDIVFDVLADGLTMAEYVKAIRLLIQLGEKEICKVLTGHKASELLKTPKLIETSFTTYKQKLPDARWIMQQTATPIVPTDHNLWWTLATLTQMPEATLIVIMSYLIPVFAVTPPLRIARQIVLTLQEEKEIKKDSNGPAVTLFNNTLTRLQDNHFINTEIINFFWANLPEYSWQKLPVFINNFIQYAHTLVNAGITEWLAVINEKLVAQKKSPLTLAQTKMAFLRSILQHVLKLMRDKEDFSRFSLAQHKSLAVTERFVTELATGGNAAKHYLLHATVRSTLSYLYSQHAVTDSAIGIYLTRLRAQYTAHLCQTMRETTTNETATAPFALRYLCTSAVSDEKNHSANILNSFIQSLTDTHSVIVHSDLNQAVAEKPNRVFIIRFDNRILAIDPVVLKQYALLGVVDKIDVKISNIYTVTISYPNLFAVISKPSGGSLTEFRSQDVYCQGDKPLTLLPPEIPATQFSARVACLTTVLNVVKEIFTEAQQFFAQQTPRFFQTEQYRIIVAKLNDIRDSAIAIDAVDKFFNKSAIHIKQTLCHALIEHYPLLAIPLHLVSDKAETISAPRASSITPQQPPIGVDEIAAKYEEIVKALCMQTLEPMIAQHWLFIEQIETRGRNYIKTCIEVCTEYDKDGNEKPGKRASFTCEQLESSICEMLKQNKLLPRISASVSTRTTFSSALAAPVPPPPATPLTAAPVTVHATRLIV
jgi:hypothetical protein